MIVEVCVLYRFVQIYCRRCFVCELYVVFWSYASGVTQNAANFRRNAENWQSHETKTKEYFLPFRCTLFVPIPCCVCLQTEERDELLSHVFKIIQTPRVMYCLSRDRHRKVTEVQDCAGLGRCLNAPDTGRSLFPTRDVRRQRPQQIVAAKNVAFAISQIKQIAPYLNPKDVGCIISQTLRNSHSIKTSRASRHTQFFFLASRVRSSSRIYHPPHVIPLGDAHLSFSIRRSLCHIEQDILYLSTK